MIDRRLIMKGKRKPFSKTEYDRSDGFGKEVVAAHLRATMDTVNYEVVVPKESQGPDIEVRYAGPMGQRLLEYHEVEVRRVWKDGTQPFPYDTAHVPERKSRLIEKAKDEGFKLYFWSVSLDGKGAIKIDSDHCTKDRLTEVPNKRIWKGEYFYDINISEYVHHTMEGQNGS